MLVHHGYLISSHKKILHRKLIIIIIYKSFAIQCWVKVSPTRFYLYRFWATHSTNLSDFIHPSYLWSSCIIFYSLGYHSNTYFVYRLLFSVCETSISISLTIISTNLIKYPTHIPRFLSLLVVPIKQLSILL